MTTLGEVKRERVAMCAQDKTDKESMYTEVTT